MKKFDRRFLGPLCASFAGMGATLGWAPHGWWWLSLVAFSILFFLLLSSRNAWQAALLGLAFGMGLHLAGHGWMFQTLRIKTGMPLVAAALATGFFALYLALFTAIPCLLWRALTNARELAPASATPKRHDPYRSRLLSTLLLASLLTVGEWLRSLFFNGFTSLSLGYALIDTVLAGYAPILGVYGLSWLGFLLAGFPVDAIQRRNGAGIFILVSIAIAGYGLGRLEWTTAVGEPMSYRLIQSNIAQERKFDPLFKAEHVARLVADITHRPARLIVTPETAFPLFLNELPSETLDRLQEFSGSTNSQLLLGIASASASGESYNSVVQVIPASRSMARYNKVKLMPFGEYSPDGFSWFTDSLNIPLKDLHAGAGTQPALRVGNQAIGVLICHEDLVGNNARAQAHGAGLFINPGNLAWFEDTAAIGQRLQIARMRALETGKPFLRSTNTGVTAHLDAHGNVLQYLPEKSEAVLSGNVQPMQGVTPYVILGEWPIVLACCLSIIAAAWHATRHRHAMSGGIAN